MLRAADHVISCRFELVDSNGILPLRATEKVFLRAFDFRRFLQNNLLPHLAEAPLDDPLENVELRQLDKIPDSIQKQWPLASLSEQTNVESLISRLPIDHSIPPVKLAGGSKQAQRRLSDFLSAELDDYGTERNQPEKQVTSRLSPYLHFGHISAHEIFAELSTKTPVETFQSS